MKDGITSLRWFAERFVARLGAFFFLSCVCGACSMLLIEALRYITSF